MGSRWRMLFVSALFVCCTPGAGKVAAIERRPPDYGAAFSKHWHDGKAELAGYALTYPRYGQLRQGRAVSIVVTEPFLKDARVKPEDPKREDFPVIKLNLVQDFQTGVYDYNLMTSAFVATRAVDGRPAGAVSKVSFSAQEWCGHVYSQLRFDADAIALDSHSYFEGEADEVRRLEPRQGGLSEDTLWLWARGLAGPQLEPGAELKLPLLDALEHARVRHRPLAWHDAVLRRAASATTVEVPAGRFEAEERTVEIVRGDGAAARWRFLVEKVPPHRLIQVERSDGYRARLLGSQRLPYWQLHDEGHERHLAALGLGSGAPPPAPAPD